MHSIYIGQLVWSAAAPIIVCMHLRLGGVTIVHSYPHPAIGWRPPPFWNWHPCEILGKGIRSADNSFLFSDLFKHNKPLFSIKSPFTPYDDDRLFMFFVIRNGLHGYQCNCSHMTEKTSLSSSAKRPKYSAVTPCGDILNSK